MVGCLAAAAVTATNCCTCSGQEFSDLQTNENEAILNFEDYATIFKKKNKKHKKIKCINLVSKIYHFVLSLACHN